ncbi:hypothetical protein H4582DRAFT_3861 [Lactarius indigo]|nr:hypothetical protein H4582DRAFT_3861 [Lactarius indigo]
MSHCLFISLAFLFSVSLSKLCAPSALHLENVHKTSNVLKELRLPDMIHDIRSTRLAYNWIRTLIRASHFILPMGADIRYCHGVNIPVLFCIWRRPGSSDAPMKSKLRPLHY